VLPFNRNSANVDTFYVRTIKKQIIADACGSLTTPHGTYPDVLREHEYITEIDSVYAKMGTFQVYAIEYARDSTNTYSYIAHGIGYPACIVHCDKHNVVKDVEYFNGFYSGIDNIQETESQLLIYPNPSNGKMTLELRNDNNKPDNNISIYNSVGALVWKKSSEEKLISIDLSTYPKGIYFVDVNNGGEIHSEKIVIE
jgi:hypothetical protein